MTTATGRLLPWLFLAPCALLLAGVVGYPLVRLGYNSLHSLSLSDPTAARFVGYGNFVELARDPDVRNAAWVTLKLGAATIPGSLLAGLVLALAANAGGPSRWLVRLSLLLPWAMPPAFAGMLFAWFFHSEHGVVNDVLVRLGFEARSFLQEPWGAFAAVSLASIWKGSSFVAIVLLAGLQGIPAELREVAVVEGAGRWQQLRHVTLPLLLPSILVALVFRVLGALHAFDVPYAMTAGGPARSTETLAILVNTFTTEFLEIGYGSSLALLLLAVSVVVSLPYLKGLERATP